VFVGVMIILLVAWQVPVLGVLMAMGGVATWIGVPVFKTFKYLALEPELHRKRGRATAFTLACVAIAIGFIGLIKFNVYVDATGVVEPIAKETINAKQGGFVNDIRVKDGQWVKQGDVLLVLADDELEAEIKKLQATLRSAVAKELKSRGTDQDQNANDRISIETYTKELAESVRRKTELTVRAPIDGQVIAPDLKFLPKKYIPRGTELCRVETNDKLVVRSMIEQREIALASEEEQDGKIHLRKDPEIRLAGDVQRVLPGGNVVLVHGGTQKLASKTLSVAGGGEITTDPRDQQGQYADIAHFEMRVDLANPSNTYVSGQRAWVRLTVGKKPLIWNWYNRFLQLIETKNKQSKWMQM
jgi:multidrug efflux pump subunit AcrA (membrane-fusion protein)